MAVINASASDFLPLQEGNPGILNPAHAFDTLVFSDSAYCPIHDALAGETLTVSESPHEKDIDAAADDSLDFTDSSSRGATASAFELLGLTDLAGLFHGGPGNDTFSLSEAAASLITKPGVDSIAFVETITGLLSPYLVLAETMAFVEYAIGLKTSCMPVDQRLAIQLMSPADAPLTTLTLCVPEFGDIRRRDFQRINRRSRGNDLIVYRDPNWVVSDHFTMRLSNLNEDQRFGLLNFLEFTTGQYIKMRDYEGNIWKGFIMNPNTPITQTGPCRYDCELQFSGGVIENGPGL